MNRRPDSKFLLCKWFPVAFLIASSLRSVQDSNPWRLLCIFLRFNHYTMTPGFVCKNSWIFPTLPGVAIQMQIDARCPHVNMHSRFYFNLYGSFESLLESVDWYGSYTLGLLPVARIHPLKRGESLGFCNSSFRINEVGSHRDGGPRSCSISRVLLRVKICLDAGYER